jgi:cystathionine beta-lyase/cystathionine gamma-synthase
MTTVLQRLIATTNQMGRLVVHSATKLMDGQGRVLGGVTVGDQN